jgi:beta-glucosidase
VEALKNHPNVTAILWAGIPGQESGNSIVDVLYGSVNPSAKSVFTWGKQRSDWGTDILYNSNAAVPQIDFTEGVFIDYRHFDALGIEPSYEFGFGLSYTTFSYSNLKVEKQNPGPYRPTTGKTSSAPTYGKIDTSPADNMFPAGFQPVKDYIYPWLPQSSSPGISSQLPPGSQDGGPQPKLGAGGAAGGNSQLYDIMYEVSCTIKNTGKVDGIEVPQLVSTSVA